MGGCGRDIVMPWLASYVGAEAAMLWNLLDL